MQEMQLEMADSSALGPHRVGTLDAAHLCTAAFSSATIYYPEGGAQLPSIVIVGDVPCNSVGEIRCSDQCDERGSGSG